MEDGGVAKQDDIAQLQLRAFESEDYKEGTRRVPREAARPGSSRPVAPRVAAGLALCAALFLAPRALAPRARGARSFAGSPAFPARATRRRPRAGPRHRAGSRAQRGAQRRRLPRLPVGADLRRLEIMAVDDGSTDRTPAILADAARRDPRVRMLRVDGPPPGLDRQELRPRRRRGGRTRKLALLHGRRHGARPRVDRARGGVRGGARPRAPVADEPAAHAVVLGARGPAGRLRPPRSVVPAGAASTTPRPRWRPPTGSSSWSRATPTSAWADIGRWPARFWRTSRSRGA